jgi:hypothetical protein
MADIVQSLFGVTPEIYQQSQQARADQQALQYAQLTPFQQANFAIGRGATMLGGAAGRALGGEDPELARITARQQISKQINYNDPTSIARAVEMLSASGDSQGAMMLADVGRKAASELALTQQRTAAANKERQMAVNPNIQIANEIASYEDTLREIETLPDSPERNRAKNLFTSRLSELKRLTTKEDKEKYSAFGQGLIDAGLTPGTEPFIKRMNEYLDSKIEGTKKGSGNVSFGGITIDASAASKEAGKIIGGNVANIEQQYSLQTAYKDAASLLNQGIYGGAFGPEKQFVAKYTGIGDPKKVRNTEVFMANIGEIVIPRLQQFGGNDSNEELKYLQNVVAGNQRLEPESMKRILASAEKKVEKNIERLRLQTQAGQTGSPLPITPVTPSTQTPTKRWNPQTRTLETVTGE